MLLVAASALGSYSRGALLAIAAMSAMLWWRGRSRALGAVVIVTVALALVGFMPEAWFGRMATIQTYDQDASAIGRLSAWTVAWNIALHNLSGVGFDAARPELFALYAPDWSMGYPVAHSIYFQVMGHHGFIGLTIFLLFLISTWRTAASIRRSALGVPEANWCFDLAGMCQVSLIGYVVGGAFLSLAYFDLPYNVMVVLVLTNTWMKRKSWQTEESSGKGLLAVLRGSGRHRRA
jgi:putative inorganic carbon (hco3(-)) transporter